MLPQQPEARNACIVHLGDRGPAAPAPVGSHALHQFRALLDDAQRDAQGFIHTPFLLPGEGIAVQV